MEEAEKLDSTNPSSFRAKFFIPVNETSGGEMIYFSGHSLGLQPKETPSKVMEMLQTWARELAVSLK